MTEDRGRIGHECHECTRIGGGQRAEEGGRKSEGGCLMGRGWVEGDVKRFLAER